MVGGRPLRGIFRYETGSGRWWACAEDSDGKRVNFTRERYELAGMEPPFLELPTEDAQGNAKPQKTG